MISLRYLIKKERGIVSQLVNFTGLRLTLNAITDILNCVKPKIVGLSAQTPSIVKAHRMAKIKGIAYRDNGKIIINKNIEKQIKKSYKKFYFKISKIFQVLLFI